MIKFLDIRKVTESFQPQLNAAIGGVVASGSFIRGAEVKRFEEEYALFIGTAYCVGVGNGFDALRLIFRAWMALGAMEEGDEVIVPANTYVASILAISDSRLTPVLVEPDLTTFNISAAEIRAKITPRTRAIMVVHLYGRNGMNAAIREIADIHGLKIVEDNAQAAGCCWGRNRTGALGDAAAHSFFPTKNLGALGDGGAVTTNDARLADTIRTLGNYGSQRKGHNALAGVNSRLDELQAAVLRVKLPRLDTDNALRRKAAECYLANIVHPDIILPADPAGATAPGGYAFAENVWHLFVIRCARRDALQAHLAKAGIETLVHYPIPPHKQPAFAHLNGLNYAITEQLHREVLSLPISAVQRESERAHIVAALNGFAT